MMDWNEHKKTIMRELARLESLPWATNETVAETIFPYVLVEAINVLKNSVIVPNPIDHTKTGDDITAMLKALR